MRRSPLGLLATAASAAALALLPAAVALPGAQAATGCATVYWGSLDKSGASHSSSDLLGVRTGQHACYDRLVIDFAGPAPDYTVKYVPQLTGIASGLPVATTGGANLEIWLDAPAYSYRQSPAVTQLGYQSLKQQVWLGSFEAQSKLGLSTRGRLPMRAFVLDGPGAGSRLVVDVAHKW